MDEASRVIRSFADKETERLFARGTSLRLPREIVRRAMGRLQHLHFAARVGDLRKPPSNRLEALKGDRAGQHSIRINDQFRVCFVWTAGGPQDVEIVDYH